MRVRMRVFSGVFGVGSWGVVAYIFVTDVLRWLSARIRSAPYLCA